MQCRGLLDILYIEGRLNHDVRPVLYIGGRTDESEKLCACLHVHMYSSTHYYGLVHKYLFCIQCEMMHLKLVFPCLCGTSLIAEGRYENGIFAI